jgi:hypothetical protein
MKLGFSVPCNTFSRFACPSVQVLSLQMKVTDNFGELRFVYEIFRSFRPVESVISCSSKQLAVTPFRHVFSDCGLEQWKNSQEGPWGGGGGAVREVELCRMSQP